VSVDGLHLCCDRTQTVGKFWLVVPGEDLGEAVDEVCAGGRVEVLHEGLEQVGDLDPSGVRGVGGDFARQPAQGFDGVRVGGLWLVDEPVGEGQCGCCGQGTVQVLRLVLALAVGLFVQCLVVYPALKADDCLDVCGVSGQLYSGP